LWDKNKAKADAAMQAMLKMRKLDIEILQEAHDNA
jgi:predicted 3-demethylubiquinone-9 3-methyltransferase (glyoxalase superfamily)